MAQSFLISGSGTVYRGAGEEWHEVGTFFVNRIVDVAASHVEAREQVMAKERQLAVRQYGKGCEVEFDIRIIRHERRVPLRQGKKQAQRNTGRQGDLFVQSSGSGLTRIAEVIAVVMNKDMWDHNSKRFSDIELRQYILQGVAPYAEWAAETLNKRRPRG